MRRALLRWLRGVHGLAHHSLDTCLRRAFRSSMAPPTATPGSTVRGCPYAARYQPPPAG